MERQTGSHLDTQVPGSKVREVYASTTTSCEPAADQTYQMSRRARGAGLAATFPARGSSVPCYGHYWGLQLREDAAPGEVIVSIPRHQV